MAGRALVAILVAVVVTTVSCLPPRQDGCPDVTVIDDFNTDSYLGRWYQWSLIPNVLEINGSCFTATYSPREGLSFDWVNRWYDEQQHVYKDMSDVARLVDDSGVGKIVVWEGIPRCGRDYNALEANYWVLGTDYETFALVYGCNKLLGQGVPHVSSWILGRDPVASPEVLAKVYSLIQANNMQLSSFVPVRQNDQCVYQDK